MTRTARVRRPPPCPCGCGRRGLCEPHRARLAAVRDSMADTHYDKARQQRERRERQAAEAAEAAEHGWNED